MLLSHEGRAIAAALASAAKPTRPRATHSDASAGSNSNDRVGRPDSAAAVTATMVQASTVRTSSSDRARATVSLPKPWREVITAREAYPQTPPGNQRIDSETSQMAVARPDDSGLRTASSMVEKIEAVATR